MAAFDADLRVLTRGTSILVVLAAIAAFAHGEGRDGVRLFVHDDLVGRDAAALLLAVVETLIPMPRPAPRGWRN